MGQGNYVGILYGCRPGRGDLSLAEDRARWDALMGLLIAWDEGRPADEVTQCAHESEPYVGFWIALGDRGLAEDRSVPWFGGCAVPVAEIPTRFRERHDHVVRLWEALLRLAHSRGITLPAPEVLLVADYD